MKMRLSQHIECFSKKEFTEWVKKHIGLDSFVVPDGLNYFPGVKDANCTHNPIVTGSGLNCVEIPEFKWEIP